MPSPPPDKDSWKTVIRGAFGLFDGLREKGFGEPPFTLGGGTVLMFRFEHRLSRDIDFFGYDAQWLSLLSPRLNDTTAAIATDYVEQANSLKIVTPQGDIDFIVAADVDVPVVRTRLTVEGRDLLIDPTSEILAKKLYYRPSSLKARDVYDMSAAIDLDPDSAGRAVRAARARASLLLARLGELRAIDDRELLREIVPFGGALAHSSRMIEKTRTFVESQLSL